MLSADYKSNEAKLKSAKEQVFSLEENLRTGEKGGDSSQGDGRARDTTTTEESGTLGSGRKEDDSEA